MDHERYRVERLGHEHRAIKREFSSGVEPLDTYLQEQASQDSRRKVAVAWVLLDWRENRIAGYYTLSAGSIRLLSLPEEIGAKLPRYDAVPAIHLGRLALDLGYRGRGLGSALLADALVRARGLSASIGAFAVSVDAKDESARQFYEHHGFLALRDARLQLFIPIASVPDP